MPVQRGTDIYHLDNVPEIEDDAVFSIEKTQDNSTLHQLAKIGNSEQMKKYLKNKDSDEVLRLVCCTEMGINMNKPHSFCDC